MPRSIVPLLALSLLGGCASPRQIQLPPRPELPARDSASGTLTGDLAASQTAIETMPAPPAGIVPTAVPAPPPPSAAPVGGGPLQINFEQVPLTTLIQVVYSDMLGRTVQIDPKVMERRDLVTFRTPPQESPEQVARAMEVLLRSYGVSVVDVAGMIRVVPDGAQSGALPEIRRGAASPETPASLRPVFQLVELQAVRNGDVIGWLKALFGNRLNASEDAVRNALLISGDTSTVNAAMSAIQVLDQPVMRGRAALRISPVYWSAAELAGTLNQVLAAEGYSMPPPTGSAAAVGGVRYPIILLPVTTTNSLLVFSTSDPIMKHVQDWVQRLDQPNKQAAGKNLFTYTARNTSAAALAETLGSLLSAGGAAPAAAAAGAGAGAGAAAAGGRAGAAAPSLGSAGRVVVDANSNTLIFNTSAENYSQLIGLLGTLDKPSKSALIEVTVAELTLDDNFKLGVEWLMSHSGASGSLVTASTLGGLGLGTSGLTIRRLDSLGDARLVLNALAGSNQARILSSPRVMARNGEVAKIQVGQEVPIITSQQSTLGTTNVNNNLGVLQTVQYRSTGVLLSVKPSIFSGDRIDLDVMQEVSGAQTTQTGVNISPTFSSRKVETKLTLQHGATVMLGGLISSDESFGDTGVPGLKDIPLVGNLFKTDTRKGSRTELIVLITPYIVNDGSDARELTDAFKNLMPLIEMSAPGKAPMGGPRTTPQ